MHPWKGVVNSKIILKFGVTSSFFRLGLFFSAMFTCTTNLVLTHFLNKAYFIDYRAWKCSNKIYYIDYFAIVMRINVKVQFLTDCVTVGRKSYLLYIFIMILKTGTNKINFRIFQRWRLHSDQLRIAVEIVRDTVTKNYFILLCGNFRHLFFVYLFNNTF